MKFFDGFCFLCDHSVEGYRFQSICTMVFIDKLFTLALLWCILTRGYNMARIYNPSTLYATGCWFTYTSVSSRHDLARFSAFILDGFMLSLIA